MTTVALTDDQWQKMLPFLRSCPTAYVGDETHCRRFVEAVLWIARSGAQWRLLPQSYGNWNHIDKRFARSSAKDVFAQLHEFCATDSDLEHLLIDSTIVRAHPCAAGAPKKGRTSRTSFR